MKKTITLLIILFITSCTLTKKMWNPYYQEEIASFMLAQNGEFVVFLGIDYHYVLKDNTGLISSLLSSQYRNLMYIDSEKTYMNLSITNNIEAYVSIKLKKTNINREIEKDLANYGFIKSPSEEVMSLKIKLSGTRYLANKGFSFAKSSALNRRYVIKVYEDISSAKKFEKAALTPITATADAVLLIGKILLVPFMGN